MTPQERTEQIMKRDLELIYLMLQHEDDPEWFRYAPKIPLPAHKVPTLVMEVK